jgi:beta-barrel assembly-enhancing protease
MPLTPVFVEKASGDASAPQMEAQYGGVSAPSNVTEYVTWVGSRLLPYSLRGSEPHKFQVLRATDVVNAFTLGNGNIYITQGLLNLLDDESELAEVLGHENGHFGHRHIAAQMDHEIGLGLLLGLGEGFLTSSKGGTPTEGQQATMDQANQITMGLVINGFQRDQELEADQHGLDTMVKAGYDPMGSVRTFQKFQGMEKAVTGLDAFMQSHPTATTRISDLEASIKKQYPGASGDNGQSRFQAIVNGGQSLADVNDSILGIPRPYAIAGGIVLAITGGIVIASVV